MNNTTKWIVGVVIAALVVWGLVAANKNKNQRNPAQKTVMGDTYKVGVMLPLTGDAASYGEPARNIYQLAVDEINAAGGVNSKKLELIVEDSKCNGKDGANAAQKLISVNKVQVIIGGFCSSESLAATPIAEANKVALFSPGSSSPKLTGVSHFFFRNYPSDASQGAVLADVAYNKKSWKKVAMMQEQTDYALGINSAFSAKFKSLGGTLVNEEFATSATDFRSQLTKLKSQNPDALFLDTQTPASAARVLKQIQDLKWKPHLIVSDILPPDTATVELYKDLLEGALGAEVGTDATNPKFSHLQEAYKSKFNVDLPFATYGQTEYDAVYMVKAAIMAVGYDGQKIADWSRTVKDWEGATGKITIGADGDPLSRHSPVMIQNGKMVPFAE